MTWLPREESIFLSNRTGREDDTGADRARAIPLIWSCREIFVDALLRVLSYMQHTHIRTFHSKEHRSTKKQYIHRLVNSIIFIQVHRETYHPCPHRDPKFHWILWYLQRADSNGSNVTSIVLQIFQSLEAMTGKKSAVNDSSHYRSSMSRAPFSRTLSRNSP